MEIHLIDTTVPAYTELARMTKKTQIAMESVVPDTREDIGRILSVCPEICLKSKDWNGHGATVTGEVTLAVLYVNEAGDAVSFLRPSQSFSIDYECPLSDEDPVLQLRWRIGPIQVRAVNPRKISADCEIQSEMTVNRQLSLPVAQNLPEENACPIHLQTEEKTLEQTLSICERSFSISEQLVFPEEAAQPSEIISRDLNFRIHEQELVGSRLLVKGTLSCRLVYLPEKESLPRRQDFSIPFSQLIELGTEDAERAQVWIEETNEYLELIDTIEGQKLLNLELHAVAQVKAYQRKSIAIITDAYSNAMPCTCQKEALTLTRQSIDRKTEMRGEEEFELPEEFSELLEVFPTLSSVSQEQATVTADLLCRSKDGRLFPMRRLIILSAEQQNAPIAGLRCDISSAETQLDGRKLRLQISAEAQGTEETAETIHRIVALDLDEEKLFDVSAFPSMTAVWPQNETLWELSKVYHSSPEAIRSMNPDETARPVFIPKSK